jgi:hypothetical protein
MNIGTYLFILSITKVKRFFENKKKFLNLMEKPVRFIYTGTLVTNANRIPCQVSLTLFKATSLVTWSKW